MKNSWRGSNRKENLTYSEKILPQCLLIHVGFVADKSEMIENILPILHYSTATVFPTVILTSMSLPSMIHDFRVAKVESQLCTFLTLYYINLPVQRCP